MGDLRADALAHFHAQLVAMGYDVEIELAAAKVEAAARASKKAEPGRQAALAQVDEAHWLCVYYLNAVKRRIEPRPRPVERAPALASNPLSQPFAVVIDEIEAASRRGDDLAARLSKSIDDLRYDDAMLNDWGIHHLHLGPLGVGPGAWAGRTGPLLFVFVREDRIYFLDVLRHGAGQRPWIRRDLVEIIHVNWPDVIRPYRVNAVGSARLSDNEVAVLRSKNANAFVETRDSTLYAPLGGGYMSSGIATEALVQTDWFFATIDESQRWAEQNAQAIRDNIFEQRGISLTEIRIALAFDEKGFEMIETQSRSVLRTRTAP